MSGKAPVQFLRVMLLLNRCGLRLDPPCWRGSGIGACLNMNIAEGRRVSEESEQSRTWPLKRRLPRRPRPST
eukprot:364634-Chlamydomonas_euryale.AAC.2